MKTKTNELIGPALDWAVARCEGEESQAFHYYAYDNTPLYLDEAWYPMWQPSTNWAQAGPIIERERMELYGDGNEGWVAQDYLRPEQYGPTPLVAAMRCYVASKLGDEVEVPENVQ